jgi:hypothetical protein
VQVDLVGAHVGELLDLRGVLLEGSQPDEDRPSTRPSPAEGGEGTDSGPRPPRPSQAEGERNPSD